VAEHSTSTNSSPVLIGVLYDFPQADRGELFEESLRLGFDEIARSGRLDRGLELLPTHSNGLPAGTAHDIERSFREMLDDGVLAIVGPTVSDNGLIVRDLVDSAGVPCINYTGGERTRGRFMFHYQVGSLDEEPIVLARHLGKIGHSNVALAYDHTPVGRGYADAFAYASSTFGLEVAAAIAVPPLAEDLSPIVRRLRAAEPDALVYLGLGVAARALALGLVAEDWKVPVVANSALMFAYARRDWRADWEGWVYVDTVSDDNLLRSKLKERAPRTAAGPIGVAAYDIGRLVGEAVARAAHLTRDGIRESLERTKQLPATSGMEGTTMGFGNWDHGALKGRYLVLRSWRDGKSVQVAEQ
jgi:branched-chain amino acid transport system substrate-binding protein